MWNRSAGWWLYRIRIERPIVGSRCVQVCAENIGKVLELPQSQIQEERLVFSRTHTTRLITT